MTCLPSKSARVGLAMAMAAAMWAAPSRATGLDAITQAIASVYVTDVMSGRMTAYWGEQSMHEILERTAWHSAQHTRQLISVLDAFGVEPEGRLTAADLQGLPLPDNVWGETEAAREKAA